MVSSVLLDLAQAVEPQAGDPGGLSPVSRIDYESSQGVVYGLNQFFNAETFHETTNRACSAALGHSARAAEVCDGNDRDAG